MEMEIYVSQLLTCAQVRSGEEMHKDYCQTYVQQHDESHQDGVRALRKHKEAHTLKSVGGLN